MKTTYLINKAQPDGSIKLSVVSVSEWLDVIKENKGLPIEQRRYFIHDYIADGGNLDCIIIETSLAEYREWDKRRLTEKQNRRARQGFQHLSLDAPHSAFEGSGSLMDLVAADTQVESTVCDQLLMDELKKVLASWKPWANDLLTLYLRGKKRTCTKDLAEKYGVSPQVIRKYKRQFEGFIKKFLGGVSF